jgi:hypothetical protein
MVDGLIHGVGVGGGMEARIGKRCGYSNIK